MYRVVHRAGLALERLQVDPGRPHERAIHLEDDHAAHLVQCSVASSAAHLPLRPDGVAVHHACEHPRRDVGDTGEDLLPVAANLITPGKAALRMRGCLVHVALGETRDDPLEVVRAGRARQTLDHICWMWCHIALPNVHHFRYSDQ
jgi:hypothetical protein